MLQQKKGDAFTHSMNLKCKPNKLKTISKQLGLISIWWQKNYGKTCRLVGPLNNKHDLPFWKWGTIQLTQLNEDFKAITGEFRIL